jgi:hypothetical protein
MAAVRRLQGLGFGSIVICEGGDCKDDHLDDLLEQSVLHITADDGDVRVPREATCDV